MSTNEIYTTFNETMAELLQLIDSFKEEDFNTIPFEGSWTAGQLTEHLVLSGSGFVQIINGPVKETDRKPDELVEKFKNDFLNFNTKMKSPNFIVPPAVDYNKQTQLTSLKDIQGGINHALNTLELSKTCVSFELPVIGFLTRLEAISFLLYHTQRHIHQLKNIYQQISVG